MRIFCLEGIHVALVAICTSISMRLCHAVPSVGIVQIVQILMAGETGVTYGISHRRRGGHPLSHAQGCKHNNEQDGDSG